MDPTSRELAAERLRSAERDRRPIAPITEAWPDLDVEDAYAIQLLNIGRRIDEGATVRGHKVGLTSKVMQEMLGVDQPDFGHLLDDMIVSSGTILSADSYCAPRVEPELAFVLRDDLASEDCTAEHVLAASSHVVPALEIIDSRIADWRITLTDTIADNASSAAVVLGGDPVDIDDIDWSAAEATLRTNGTTVATGLASAVLGHPANAVAWLVRTLHGLGSGLVAGEIVMPGSCTAAVAVSAGDEVAADFGPIGAVMVRFR